MSITTPAKKVIGRPFPKGVSGNPKGRPEGSRSKSSLIAEELMRGKIRPLTRAVIAATLDGDMGAARLVFERICPVRKGAPIKIDGIPKIDTLADVKAAMSAISAKMMSGEISPEEAMATTAVVEMQRRAIETIDLEKRIAALEGAP